MSAQEPATTFFLSGGEISCEFINTLGENSVKYKVNICEDWKLCPDENQDADFIGILFSAYEKNNDTFNLINTFSYFSFTDTLIDINNPEFNCQTNNEYCRKRGTYSKDIILPITSNSIYLIAQKCCRDTSLVNVSSLSEESLEGITLFLELRPEAVNLENSNPLTNCMIPSVICKNQFFSFNVNAVDVDNDSLVYEFSPLFNGGGNETSSGDCNSPVPSPTCPPPFNSPQFLAPYSFSSPLGSNVTLNSATGELQGIIDDIGTFAFGLAIKEYRNNIFIAETYREYHLNVIDCSNDVVASVLGESEDNNTFHIESCDNLSVQIYNTSTDTVFIEDWYFEFEIDGTTVLFDEWSPLIDFPYCGEFNGLLIINPNQICSDTAFITISASKGLEANFNYSYDSCSVAPIQLMDNSSSPFGEISSYQWLVENENLGSQSTIDYEFPIAGNYNISLSVSDESGCSDTNNKSISYYPIPLSFDIDASLQTGCSPLPVIFNNLTPIVDSNYLFFWEFGDGNTSLEQHPEHTYQNEGNYSVNLEIISPLGCEQQQEFHNLITTSTPPVADFSISPEIINSLNPEVSLKSLTQEDNSYEWYINNDVLSNSFETTYILNDTGAYEVKLITTNNFGCFDIKIKTIYNSPEITYYLPNAFTPNGDGINDIFKGTGAGFIKGIQDYSLTVWNRYGDLCFHTNDIKEGWSGRDGDSGRLHQQGNYKYHVYFSLGKNKIYEFSGSVLLLK